MSEYTTKPWLIELLQEATSYLVERGFTRGADHERFLDRVSDAVIASGGRTEIHSCELCGKTFHEESDLPFSGGKHATAPDSDDSVWVCNPCDELNTGRR